MSKEYYRKKIADKREEIVSLRAKIAKVKTDKKRRITSLTQSVKILQLLRVKKLIVSRRFPNQKSLLEKKNHLRIKLMV